MLEREQTQWKRHITQFEDQIQCIQAMREEAGLVDKEDVMETLKQAAFRSEVLVEANRRVDTAQFKQVFNEVKRDEELQTIAKLVLPSKMTLLNNTVTY